MQDQWLLLMNVGDLVRYKIKTDALPDLGVIIEDSPNSERPMGDTLLVLWSTGKTWYCQGKWLEHLSSVPCNRPWHVVL